MAGTQACVAEPGRARRRAIIRATAALSAAAVLAGASGCYERVVEARGAGTEGVTTYEPNLKDERTPVADDAIFGERKAERRSPAR